MADLVGEWASCSPHLRKSLAGEMAWHIDGDTIDVASEGLEPVFSSVKFDRLELRSIITHGREAACEGTGSGPGTDLDFAT